MNFGSIRLGRLRTSMAIRSDTSQGIEWSMVKEGVDRKTGKKNRRSGRKNEGETRAFYKVASPLY